MIYLLDVNVLIAFGYAGHQFHERAAVWIASVSAVDQFAMTAITELGFVRILSQAYGIPVARSKQTLAELKEHSDLNFTFVPDDHDASKLPSWATSAKHTTDGHLVELAKSHGCILATFDEKIPGACDPLADNDAQT